MLLEREKCYEALLSHDTRFDGRFFVGVTSTGIYCRPVCRVRPPQLRNCNFYVSAAAAEAAGFRPCLRCRPELAPGHADVESGARIAQMAANALRSHEEGDETLEELARRLGVTDRHLRRVFSAEYGVAPIQYAQTQRLLLAKRLLADTDLPVSEIAFASGFRSLRRFNALIQERYRLSPTAMRHSRGQKPETTEADFLHFDLAYRPPLAWAYLLAFLAGRAIPGVESVENGVYYRAIALSHAGQRLTGVFKVEQSTRENYLRLTIPAHILPVLTPVMDKTKRLFDLSADPLAVSESLGSLAKSLPGARVPGCIDEFELAVRAVVGQQVSVKGARTLLGRIAAAFGSVSEASSLAPELTLAFPPAADLAQRELSEITALGLTKARASTIITLARAVVSGRLRLQPGAPIHESLQALRNLPGIGEWTAQYIAMRALAWPDAFPHGDLVLRKALGGVTPKRCLELAEPWRPWRAYAAIHLWHSTTINNQL